MQRLVFVNANASSNCKEPEQSTFLKFVYSGTYDSLAPSSSMVLSGSSAERPRAGSDYKEGAYAVEWSLKTTPKVTQEEKDETARLHPNSRIDGQQSREEAEKREKKEDETSTAPPTTKKRPAAEPEDPDSEQKTRKKTKKRKNEGKPNKKTVTQGSTAARNRAEATKVIEDPEQVQKVLVEASSSS